MDKSLEKCFEKLETSVNALVDSMTTYNPSIPALETFLAADDEFSDILSELIEHQENYDRIAYLRTLSDTLDDQIKGTIRLLADTRQEILNMPWTPVNTDMRNVPVDELLLFAKNISKYTVPPTAPKQPPQTQSSSEASAQQNGIDASLKDSFADLSLTDQQKSWLDAISAQPFVPWPTNEIMRIGALAHITRLQLDGQDPGVSGMSIDTSVGGMKLDEQVPSSAMELESAGPSGREAAVGSAGGSGVQRGSRSGPGGGERKRESFAGFGLYDPDEDV